MQNSKGCRVLSTHRSTREREGAPPRASAKHRDRREKVCHAREAHGGPGNPSRMQAATIATATEKFLSTIRLRESEWPLTECRERMTAVAVCIRPMATWALLDPPGQVVAISRFIFSVLFSQLYFQAFPTGALSSRVCHIAEQQNFLPIYISVEKKRDCCLPRGRNDFYNAVHTEFSSCQVKLCKRSQKALCMGKT